MDEQRIQAYLELINQLLSCPDGQEMAILQANQEILDPGFVQVMGVVAEQIRHQGNETTAQWLQSLAMTLVEAMGLSASTETQSGKASQSSTLFFAEVLSFIKDHQNSPELIYQYFSVNVDKLNADLLEAIPIIITKMVAHSNEDSQVYIADKIIGKFGDLIQNFPLGQRAINVELAIKTYEQALQITTREAAPIAWAQSMMGMANAYSNRIYGDRLQNIEQAIEAYRQALQVMTREAMPGDWAKSMMNLAIAYYYRIRNDRAQNIERAIDTFRQALQVITREAMPVEWAQLMMNLGTAYKNRIRNDRAQNIEVAIDAYQQSLQVRTREAMPIAWAISMHNLANAYVERICDDSAQNIEQAIDIFQQALQVRTREAMPVEWAKSMNGLANAYVERICDDSTQNIERAIDIFQQALQVMTREAMPIEWARLMNNLAKAYTERICEDRKQNIENAIDACKHALTVFQPQLLPNDCRRTARLLGDLYASQRRWRDANTAYETAIEAANILYQSALSRGSQEAELSETSDLFLRTAFAQAKTGQLADAVTTLDQGRARGLREILERDRADLSALANSNPEVYQQYQQAAEAVRQLEIYERSLSFPKQGEQLSASESELRQQAEMIQQGLSDAISAIRYCPGYENFLEQLSFEDIATTVKLGQPLVYLLPTPNGSLALIVHQTQPGKDITGQVNVSPIWLNTLTDTSLRELLVGSGDELAGWFGAYNRQNTDHNAWFQAIDQITHQLWTLVMEAVITSLKALNVNEAVLIPTSFLSFLPLHAAWAEDSSNPTGRCYALDDITFTYAPNARSLQAARAIGQKTTTHSLLAINEPRPTQANALPSSEQEVEVAVDCFQESHCVLKHEQATHEAVLSALPNYDVLHFSCHGYANLDSPLESGLLMANDKVLSLRDFFNIDLQGVRLAILSACETGLPGAELPDEVVSLPTGLLQAGVAGVAASLWPVSDLSTMMLLVRFYDYWQNNKLAPAQALRNAQKWVRDTSNGEKEAYFKGMIPELASSRMPHAAASFLYQSVAFSDPSSNDMAHPYYWAAFTYVGI